MPVTASPSSSGREPPTEAAEQPSELANSSAAGARGPSARASRWSGWRATIVKVVIAAAILALLLYLYGDQMLRMLAEPIRWGLVVPALLLCTAAAVITFVRWHLLVWAQELPFKMKDALRLGFIGYLFNFCGPGLVGGDLFKAIFIAREQSSRRTVAVATVLLDRLIGMISLFLLGAIVSLAFWPTVSASRELRLLTYVLWGLSGAGLLGMVVLFSPMVYRWRWVCRAPEWPLVGRFVGEIFRGVGLYQQKLRVIVIAVVMSLVSHAGFIAAFYLLAVGLPGAAPTLAEHFLFYPIASFFGAVVLLVPGGLGVTEGAIVFFYRQMLPGVPADAARAKGLLVSLAFRLLSLVIAAIGAAYYFFARRELTEVLEAAREEG